MKKLSTLLLPQGNKRLKAAIPAILNRYLLSNLNLPYPHLSITVS